MFIGHTTPYYLIRSNAYMIPLLDRNLDLLVILNPSIDELPLLVHLIIAIVEHHEGGYSILVG